MNMCYLSRVLRLGAPHAHDTSQNQPLRIIRKLWVILGSAEEGLKQNCAETVSDHLGVLENDQNFSCLPVFAEPVIIFVLGVAPPTNGGDGKRRR